MRTVQAWSLVLVGGLATACGGGAEECSPECASGFECYHGACIPRESDSGTDGASETGDQVPDGRPDARPDGGCTRAEDCPDDNPCTQDLCDPGSGACQHPAALDGTPCPDGICCGGGCQVGAECCTSDQCAGGCRGTARACAETPLEFCGSQTGCSDSGAGTCEHGAEPRSGPYCDELGLDAELCRGCGCYFMLIGCTSGGSDLRVPCLELGAEDCTTCLCTWTAGCTGFHDDCNTYGDRSSCDTQLDCYWSVCLDHLCT